MGYLSKVTYARMIQLNEQLHNVKLDKNMMGMDYIGKIQKIVDDLALIDCKVYYDDIIRACLRGLPLICSRLLFMLLEYRHLII